MIVDYTIEATPRQGVPILSRKKIAEKLTPCEPSRIF